MFEENKESSGWSRVIEQENGQSGKGPKVCRSLLVIVMAWNEMKHWKIWSKVYHDLNVILRMTWYVVVTVLYQICFLMTLF